MPNPSNLVTPGSTILTITGTKNNDVISINDNGTGTAGNIFVSYGGSGEYMSTGAVSEILVKTETGKDQVTYELDGNLQPNFNEFVNVGSGVKKGGGSVQFTVNVVGKVLDNSILTTIGVPDAKKPTTMTVNDSGEIDGLFEAGIGSSGAKLPRSRGPEVLSFSSTASIGSDGEISAGLVESRRNDVANIAYSGTNNGEIDPFVLGEGGKDQLSADIYMIPGPTGNVGLSTSPAVLVGSGRKDQLRFTIHQGTDTTTTSNIFAELIATSKHATTVHTQNVTAMTKGSDTIVS
jgi:hypothetical protein